MESEEDEDERAVYAQSSPSMMQFTNNVGTGAHNGGGGGAGRVARAAGGYSKPPGSTTSSVDGYESFENTNNKKKRKIPLSNSANGHHSSLSADMANMGIGADGGAVESVEGGGGNGVGQYYGSGASVGASSGSGTGISGAGRGRYGRSGRTPVERRPLGASTNGLNAYANGGKVRRDWSSSSPAAKGSFYDTPHFDGTNMFAFRCFT